MWMYDDSRAALRDVLRLSRAMTSKAAVADLPLGGGKGVIMVPNGDSMTPARRRAALLDFGDTVAALQGHYITAEDVGTSSRDMSVIAQRTEHVAGLPRKRGGSGDPSPFTALGVHVAIKACCQRVYGSSSLQGRKVGVLGLGHVGSRVAKLCAKDGAKLLLADVDRAKRRLADELGASWATPAKALDAKVDVLVPCALGGFLDDETVPRLRCRIIAGAANNQLADDRIADLLSAHEILWAPDFVVNSPANARMRVRHIADTLGEIFDHAEKMNATPLAAANALARERLRA
jgi:leucine dehydrogenase